MKRYGILLLFILSLTGISHAQNYSVPEKYEIKTSADAKKYDKEILNAVNWLNKTPWTEEKAKRQNAAAFVLMWAVATDDVSLEIFKGITDLADKNPDMLVVYMTNYCKYVLDNNYSQDKTSASIFALHKVIEAYGREKVEKDKDIDKIAKLDDASLRKWITDNYK